MSRIIHSWDTAIKAGVQHDASVCLRIRQCETPPLHRIESVWRGRVEYPQLKRQLLQLAAQDAPVAILIEDKASGQSLIQDVRRETSLPIIAVLPRCDKVTRFARVTPMLEAGLVGLPHSAPWLAAFEEEVLGFPQGAHDDQVDALSQYLNWVRTQQWQGLGLRSL